MAEGMKEPQLKVELVPASAWGSNVRDLLSRKAWDTLRRQVAEAANWHCELCSRQGRRHPVECHEVWQYDDEKHIQRLQRLIALCPSCHMVKHAGSTTMRGQGRMVVAQLAKVNHWSYRQAEDHLNEAVLVFDRRSHFEWTLDTSGLAQYGVESQTREVRT